MSDHEPRRDHKLCEEELTDINDSFRSLYCEDAICRKRGFFAKTLQIIAPRFLHLDSDIRHDDISKKVFRRLSLRYAMISKFKEYVSCDINGADDPKIKKGILTQDASDALLCKEKSRTSISSFPTAGDPPKTKNYIYPNNNAHTVIGEASTNRNKTAAPNQCTQSDEDTTTSPQPFLLLPQEMRAYNLAVTDIFVEKALAYLSRKAAHYNFWGAVLAFLTFLAILSAILCSYTSLSKTQPTGFIKTATQLIGFTFESPNSANAQINLNSSLASSTITSVLYSPEKLTEKIEMAVKEALKDKSNIPPINVEEAAHSAAKTAIRIIEKQISSHDKAIYDIDTSMIQKEVKDSIDISITQAQTKTDRSDLLAASEDAAKSVHETVASYFKVLQQNNKQLNAVDTIFKFKILEDVTIFIKAFTFYGLLITLSVFSYRMTKAFFDQAERIKDRRHALRQGRLFVHLNGGRLTIHELEKAFNWNVSQPNAFANINTEAQAPWGNVVKELTRTIRETAKAGMKAARKAED